MVRLFVDYFGARWRCCQPLIYQNKFLNWLCHVLADAAAESIEVGSSRYLKTVIKSKVNYDEIWPIIDAQTTSSLSQAIVRQVTLH